MTKSIGIGGLERDMTNEEWGAHLRERERREFDAPYHGSEHYIGALERLKEHSVATARREEHERQKDGISGNGGDAFIGKMCNTGKGSPEAGCQIAQENVKRMSNNYHI